MSQATPNVKNEREWQALVMEFARLNGWHVAHFRPAMMRSGRWATAMSGDVGFPDLALARDGVVLLAELKVKAGKRTPEQWKWAQQIGAAARLWYPMHWPEVQEELKRPSTRSLHVKVSQ